MNFDVEKLSAKDKKIVADNPEKTLYELLDLGLSEVGYKKLLAQESDMRVSDQALEPQTGANVQEAPESEDVETENEGSIPKSNILEVTTETVSTQNQKRKTSPSGRVKMEKVTVENIQTKKRTTMAYHSAKLLNPDEFKIIHDEQ